MSVLINGPQVNRSAWTKCILIMCTVSFIQPVYKIVSMIPGWIFPYFVLTKMHCALNSKWVTYFYKVLTIQGGQTKIPLNFLKIMIFYRTKIQKYLLPVRRNFILNVNTLWKIAPIELGLICDVKIHILVYL